MADCDAEDNREYARYRPAGRIPQHGISREEKIRDTEREEVCNDNYHARQVRPCPPETTERLTNCIVCESTDGTQVCSYNQPDRRHPHQRQTWPGGKHRDQRSEERHGADHGCTVGRRPRPRR